MCIDGDRAHPQRSIPGREVDLAGCVRRAAGRISANRRERPVHLAELDVLWRRERTSGAPNGRSFRSEEHTSELQSHHDLVCRLLLEKKKKKNQILTIYTDNK